MEDLNVEEIVETFYEKRIEKDKSNKLEVEKGIKKVINFMLSGKIMKICLIAG